MKLEKLLWSINNIGDELKLTPWVRCEYYHPKTGEKTVGSFKLSDF